jgi:F-type H+-transporting ATPase subunit b
MDLVTPNLGLMFWTGLIFVLLLFILTKFIWKPILSAVNTREKSISDSLELAEKTMAEMKTMQAQNESLIKEARAERDAIVKEAREVAVKMVEDSKNNAKVEAEKIITSAREAINNEKISAIAELKTQIAEFSIQIAEKVVRGELASDEKQTALSEKLAADFKLN